MAAVKAQAQLARAYPEEWEAYQANGAGYVAADA